MDANAQTGKRMKGEGCQDEGILGNYGRDNLEHRLPHGVLHCNGDQRSRQKRIDYILKRQPHRGRVYNMLV